MYFITGMIILYSVLQKNVDVIPAITNNPCTLFRFRIIQGVQASCGRRPDSHTSGTTQPRAKVDTLLGMPTWAQRTPIRTNSLQLDFWEIFFKN